MAEAIARATANGVKLAHDRLTGIWRQRTNRDYFLREQYCKAKFSALVYTPQTREPCFCYRDIININISQKPLGFWTILNVNFPKRNTRVTDLISNRNFWLFSVNATAAVFSSARTTCVNMKIQLKFYP